MTGWPLSAPRYKSAERWKYVTVQVAPVSLRVGRRPGERPEADPSPSRRKQVTTRRTRLKGVAPGVITVRVTA
ncbi:hypothetical protein QFZ71_002350 [Streptomyces sp. V2I9]|nr:hypothetical protein [Streptomyces sp. V2I9]